MSVGEIKSEGLNRMMRIERMQEHYSCHSN